MNNSKLLIAGFIVLIVVVGAVALLSNQALNSNNQGAGDQTTTPVGQEAANRVEVTVKADGFEPKSISVKAGGKVLWINQSGETANVSSDSHPTHQLNTFLNLGEFSQGSSVETTFEKPGSYSYHNHLKPEQTGTVIVE